MAYALFFQRLAEWDVPYLVLGNEPAQCKNLIYNGMAPALYFRPQVQALARMALNVGRVLTLRRPFRPGQMELYMTVRQLSSGGGKQRLYHNELVERAGRTGRLPALVHVDFDAVSDTGVYDWSECNYRTWRNPVISMV